MQSTSAVVRMGLGLVVGVAALAVISARAVVERRRQIGVLRGIGFRRRAILATFLIESPAAELVEPPAARAIA